MMTDMSALSVGLIPLHRFTMTPFASFLDVLRLAADKGDRSKQRNCSWVVTSPGQSMVTSSAGVQIATDRQTPDPRRFHYIAVFGGVLDADTELSPDILNYLRRAESLGVPLIGICTGSYALVKAGLMKDRRCCISWFHHRDYLELIDDDLLETGQLFLEDRDRITCAGGTSAGDLALWLVDRHLGKRWAQKCQRIMLLDEVRSPDHMQPLPTLSARVLDPHLRSAILTIERNLCEEISTAMLADTVGISRRHLERKFRQELNMGVQEFIREQRLEQAWKLVINTNHSITDIAYESGFSHHIHFRTLFSRKFGISPKRLRIERSSSPGELM